MIDKKMIDNGVSAGKRISKQVGKGLWAFAKSENALALIKMAATFAAFVHSIEEWRKTSRPVGFQPDENGWGKAKKKIGFK